MHSTIMNADVAVEGIVLYDDLLIQDLLDKNRALCGVIVSQNCLLKIHIHIIHEVNLMMQLARFIYPEIQIGMLSISQLWISL